MGGTINPVTALPSIVVSALCAALTQLPAAAPLRIGAPAVAVQPGSVVVLAISGATPGGVVRARAFGRELTPFRNQRGGWQILVGIDLDVRPGQYAVEADEGPGGPVSTRMLTVIARRFRTRTLNVNPDLVNPPAAAMERISGEAERLRRLWSAPSTTRRWSAPFVRPVPDTANSSFGTRSIYNGEPRAAHGGTDFASPTGRPIKAPNAGRVLLAESLYFTGGTVVIDHGGGVLSMLAHLSVIGVAAGDEVTAGDVIGEVGATGRVTGPHLHWAVRVDGARVDPLLLLTAFAAAPSR
jgi:hypothetical protein